MTPGGEEEEDVQIVSLMALGIKNKFDQHFATYKDNLWALKTFMQPYGSSPSFTKDLTHKVDGFFDNL